MKIEKTEHNLNVANELLLSLTDREAEMKTSGGDCLTLCNGKLLYYYSACGIDNDEIIICYPIQLDSFGDPWNDATPEDMLEFLQDFLMNQYLMNQ